MELKARALTAIGLTPWNTYLRGHLEAVDILLVLDGWQLLLDGYVRLKTGAPGGAKMRGIYQDIVAVWGLVGMPSKRSL
jgi:hypothetical protein